MPIVVRNVARVFVAVTAIFVLLGISYSPAEAQPVPDQYIVVLQDDAQPDSAVRSLGVAPMRVYRHALKGFSAQMPAQAAAALARNPMVKYVEQDQVANLVAPGKDPIVIHGKPPKNPTPTPTPEPTPEPTPSQAYPWGILKIGVDTTDTSDLSGIGVAVIDTGIDLDHPDLNVDPVNTFTAYSSADDDHGHGSHVAGTIGAKNNTIGVLGVAPGVKLYSVKVLNRRGSGFYSDIIAGVDWVTANAGTLNIKAANMSLGGGGSNALDTAVRNSIASGVIYVVAAGNSSANASNYSPARVQEAVTVSAVDSNDNLAYFSNYGEVVDIAAPGVSVYSCYKNGGYATMSGTSMASPHVCGAIALYLGIDRTNYFVDAYINELDVIYKAVTLDPGKVDQDGDNEPRVQVTNFY